MTSLLDIVENTEDISLWALDETGKRLESNNFYSWSPIGKPTIIERNGSHKGINIIGATEVAKHFKFKYHSYSKEEGSIGSSHIIKFLEELIAYDRARGVNVTMVQWDNAKIHTSEEVREFAKNHEQDLILINQPAYSPELNPQENMWKWLKGFISKATAAANVQELLKRIEDFDTYITGNLDEVKQRLCARNFFYKTGK